MKAVLSDFEALEMDRLKGIEEAMLVAGELNVTFEAQLRKATEGAIILSVWFHWLLCSLSVPVVHSREQSLTMVSSTNGSPPS